MAGITSGTADIAFIGREGYRSEIRGFKGRFGYEPLGIEISSGSFGTPHKTFSLEVFAHRSNPIKGLSMAQAEAIFGCAQPGMKAIRTGAIVGVTGAMASHPIHVYGYQFDTGMAGFFNRVVLHDAGTWNDALKDFDNGRDAAGEVINAGVYILKALADDPGRHCLCEPAVHESDRSNSLGLRSMRAALMWRQRRRPSGTAAIRSIASRRCISIVKPGTRVDPKVKEFIRYILSREGMQAVSDDGSYTPLTRHVAAEQRHKLD